MLPVFIEAAKDRLEFIKNAKDKIMNYLNLTMFLGFKWKDKNNYKQSHWYQFQKAVKELQEEAETILERNTFSKMELEKL